MIESVCVTVQYNGQFQNLVLEQNKTKFKTLELITIGNRQIVIVKLKNVFEAEWNNDLNKGDIDVKIENFKLEKIFPIKY